MQCCGSPGTDRVTRATARGSVTCMGVRGAKLTGVVAIDDPAAVARGRRLVGNELSWDEACTWREAL